MKKTTKKNGKPRKKAGSTRHGKRKTPLLTLLVGVERRERWRAAAGDLTLSEWLRRVADEAAAAVQR